LHPNTRKEQVKVLINQIKYINKDKLPILLNGDFNESPSNEVRKLIEWSSLNLSDPWLALNTPEEGSHHKFDGNNKQTKRIDWVLHTKEFSPIEIQLIKTHENNLYPSDHFPVEATLKINL